MQQHSGLKLIGHYSYYLSSCLGQGSFGKVYEGFENSTKKKVAIKKVDFKMIEKDSYLEGAIYSEIKILSKFKHPNIVELYEVLNSKRSLYIIMEFCQDGDLKKMLQKKGRLQETEAYNVARQIAAGFKELQKQKVIHRDLKPANILIHDNIYKICDFGFSKYVDNVFDVLKSCVGSPIYMAPQILQKQKYSYKCDIWSFGIIYFEMLHGSPPWRGMNQMDLLKNIKSIQLRLADCFSEKVTKFIGGMLNLSEDKRLGWEEVYAFFGLNGPESPLQNKSTVPMQGPFGTSPSVVPSLGPSSTKSASSQQVQRPTTPNNKPLTPQQLKAPIPPPPMIQPQKSQSVPTGKVLTKYFFQQLAFRMFICSDISSKLSQLKKYNFSKHIFLKYMLLLSWSVVHKFEKYKGDIDKITDQAAMSMILYQHQHSVFFLQDLCQNIKYNQLGDDFQKQQWKRLLQPAILSSTDTLQENLRTMSYSLLDQLMEQVKSSQQEQQRQLLMTVMDNICDMLTINEQFIRTGEISFSKILKERSEKQSNSMEKSMGRMTKISESRRTTKNCFFT